VPPLRAGGVPTARPPGGSGTSQGRVFSKGLLSPPGVLCPERASVPHGASAPRGVSAPLHSRRPGPASSHQWQGQHYVHENGQRQGQGQGQGQGQNERGPGQGQGQGQEGRGAWWAQTSSAFQGAWGPRRGTPRQSASATLARGALGAGRGGSAEAGAGVEGARELNGMGPTGGSLGKEQATRTQTHRGFPHQTACPPSADPGSP